MSFVLNSKIDIQNQLFLYQDSLKVTEKEKKFIVSTFKGIMVLNQKQASILYFFREQPKSIQEAIEEFPELKKENIIKFLDILIYEKLLVDIHQSKVRRKTFKYFFDCVTKFALPKKLFVFIIEKILIKMNITLLKLVSIAFMIAALFLSGSLISYSGFDWSSTPRLLMFLVIGFVIACYHELWLGYFVIRSGGDISDLKLRVILGVFATLAVNWKSLILLSRKEKIKVFLYTDLFTSSLCSLFMLIGFVFMLRDNRSMALTFCTYAMVGYSYLAINLWPFLFKSDGYNIYCFLTETTRVKRSFFGLIYHNLRRKQYPIVKQEKRLYYYVWGSLFIATLILLQVALILGIRLRI